jgi:signal transduction histidine kinase
MSAGLSPRVREMLSMPAGDLALAGALALLALLDVLLTPDWRGPTAVNVVVVPLMALSLSWRRRWPLAVLAVVIGGLVFLSLAFGGSQAWSNVFITVVAVYSAAAHGSEPLVAAVLAAAGVAVHDLRDPEIQTFGDAVWSSTLLALTFLAGLSGRALKARERTLVERAATLEREEKELAAAAVAEERRRIARELHDIISHSLGVLVLQAGAAEQVLERDPKRAREVLESIRATGQDAIGEMNTLLGLVRGDAESSREPQPTLSDLEELVARMRDAGVPVDLTIEGRQRPLSAALELSAFRVVQEGLTNALKHAGGAPTSVTLRYGDEELEVSVENAAGTPGDGPGARRGLAGMRERVAVFGGRLDAGPRPGAGWAVRAGFPLAR